MALDACLADGGVRRGRKERAKESAYHAYFLSLTKTCSERALMMSIARVYAVIYMHTMAFRREKEANAPDKW